MAQPTLDKLSLIFIFSLVSLSTVFCEESHEEPHEEHGRVDVFHKILTSVNATGETLHLSGLDKFLDKLFHQFSCKADGPCTDSLCLNGSGLFDVVGANTSVGLTEDQFQNASLILFYFSYNIQSYCKQTVDPSIKTYAYYENATRAILFEPGHDDIEADTIDEALEHIVESFDYEHVHDHDHDHEDHEDHDDHGDHEDHEDHDEHEVDVVREKCISPDAVFYQLQVEGDHIESDRLPEVTSFIVYNFYLGSRVNESCLLLPKPRDITSRIFTLLGAKNGSLTTAEVDILKERLGLTSDGKEDHDHGDHGDHDDHAGHDHAVAQRRRRSATAAKIRSKRQTDGHNHGTTASVTNKCFSAAEIKAIYGLRNDDVITETKFVELSPALLYMQLSNSCAVVDDHNNLDTIPAMAERYGYGTLAVVIICLCSIFGVIIFPLSKGGCYDAFMGVFLGLAVGTLSSDAILHLLPQAFGLHLHEAGHNHAHGPGPVIEDYTFYALVVIAGWYVFYLIESLMIVFGPVHSHSHSHSPSNSYPVNDLHVTSEKIENGLQSEADGVKKESKFSLLAFMIVVGDGIHNFADGLAIGAAFNLSNPAGIATSIAVFCHELPHELGDFAVLLQTGMSFKRAVFWNLVSSLTALIGLYVGLSVATNIETRRWIFAATSGMFLYIALVDLLPDMVRSLSKDKKVIFAMHNIGILLGFALMIILVLYEESIAI